MTEAYRKRLKDARWQKKRLDILARDSWTCQACGEVMPSNGLNVHHFAYGPTPWGVDDADLVTVCEGCHEKVHSDGHIEWSDDVWLRWMNRGKANNHPNKKGWAMIV